VAGVRALMMRIGFVGELGYEIHFPPHTARTCGRRSCSPASPRASARSASSPAHPAPAEAAHNRRAGHRLRVDAVWRGHAVAVKLDKDEQFIGRWALAHAAVAPAETALVGFTVADDRLPSEEPSCSDGRGAVAGQVTSARRSRQLGRVIGMAWVPSALADDGQASRSPTTARGSRLVVTSRSTTGRGACCARERAAPVSLAFLTADAALSRELHARSPMERSAVAAGARLSRVEGWNVANAYSEPSIEWGRLTRTVASSTARASASWRSRPSRRRSRGSWRGQAVVLVLEAGSASCAEGTWWCPGDTRSRAGAQRAGSGSGCTGRGDGRERG